MIYRHNKDHVFNIKKTKQLELNTSHLYIFNMIVLYLRQEQKKNYKPTKKIHPLLERQSEKKRIGTVPGKLGLQLNISEVQTNLNVNNTKIKLLSKIGIDDQFFTKFYTKNGNIKINMRKISLEKNRKKTKRNAKRNRKTNKKSVARKFFEVIITE